MDIQTVEHLKAFLSAFTQGLEGYIGLTITDRSQEDATANKRWGAFQNLYVEVANGEVNLPFDVLADAQDLEVYYTPVVLSEQSRLQAKFAASRVAWIDFDEPVDWQHFNPAPSIVVQTSENKHHCYWLMSEPITDVNDQRYWNKRFLEFFNGGDESGFDATQLLKLPWGKNLKFGSRLADGSAFEPRVLKYMPDLKYTEAGLAHMPEPTVQLPDAVDLSTMGELPESDKGWAGYLEDFKGKLTPALVEKVGNRQDGGEEKRSGVLFGLTKSLLEALTSPEDVYHILLGSPNDKFSADHGMGKGAALLWKDINRIAAKREIDVASEGIEDFINRTLDDKTINQNQKGNIIAEYVLSELEETGVFVHSTIDECFYYDHRNGESAKVYSVDDKLSSPFAGLICDRSTLNSGTSTNILKGVLNKAINVCRSKPKTKFHHFAHYNEVTNRVYVDRYNGQMYVLNGTTVEVQSHGADGVYFYGTENDEAKAFEYSPLYRPGGLDAYIFDGPNYTTQGNNISRPELRHLLKTWVTSFFFIDRMKTKPIVLMWGAAGSGKTCLYQCLSTLFTGEDTDAVTEIPKDTATFNMQVTQSSYIFYDNVEVNKAEMQEKLAQVATGYNVKLRKLYTTNDMASVKARSFVGITSRTIDKIQEDVVERYIIIPVHPFKSNTDHQMKPMSVILRDVTANRDILWSELLDFVNKVILQLERTNMDDTTTKLRMADYGAMLEVTSKITGMSPVKIEKFIEGMQGDVVGENDPLFTAIGKLVEQPNHDPHKKYSPTEAHAILTRANRKVNAKYGSANKMSRQIKVFIGNGQFERNGFLVTPHTSGNNNLYSFEDIR